MHWQERLHPRAMELGLGRVCEVACRLGLRRVSRTIVTVAGTNGKGSSVALLESILRVAGYQVGSYTSPHFLRYNERVRLNGSPVDDQTLCLAFADVEAAREGIGLTYFEFGTLAALKAFDQAALDVALLEVGLGGRLDAVNIMDPDLALITSIGLDHTEWLGPDREAIGYEKSGIMRRGSPVVCGDPCPPESVAGQARVVGARLYRLGIDFGFEAGRQGWWTFRGGAGEMPGLPAPALPGKVQIMNAASVLQALELLRGRLPVTREMIEQGLREVRLLGRFQRIHGRVETILDVAHNPDAARMLASTLSERRGNGRVLAVFSALADKDVGGMIEALSARVATWYIAPVGSSRSLPLEGLAAAFSISAPRRPVRGYRSVAEAYGQAVEDARPADSVLVFGSAFTVAEVLPVIQSGGSSPENR